jgi:SAM-dependent methyltransferase/uncharacterized protein YbaR (Trm112 family)
MSPKDLLLLLRCPACHGSLIANQSGLACPTCTVTYPIDNGTPALFVPTSPFRSVRRTSDEPTRKRGLWGAISKTLRAETRLTLTLNDSYYSRLSQIPADKIVLNLGSGAEAFDRQIKSAATFVNMDVDPTRGRIDLLGDGHDLPFADESFDAVLCNAVLEHVQRPWRVADEMWRVLKPGGEVFVDVPFLYIIHDTHDYYRFTDKGVQILFSKFKQVDLGVSGGPSSFLGPFLITYISTFLPGRYLRFLSWRTLSLVLWPLKFLDLVVGKGPRARFVADSFYFIGVKE